MKQVLEPNGTNAFTVVCPWVGAQSDNPQGEVQSQLMTKFATIKLNKNDKVALRKAYPSKGLAKYVSIATGDGCLSGLYLLLIRNIRRLQK